MPVPAEYLIHKGYIKGDAVPAKYTTVKPETVLKANRVLTEGVVDPASMLCADKAAAHVGAVISLLPTDKVQAALATKGFTVEVPTAEDIASVEATAGAVDTAWATTPLSTTMLESQVVEAGWGYVPLHACVLFGIMTSPSTLVAGCTVPNTRPLPPPHSPQDLLSPEAAAGVEQ